MASAKPNGAVAFPTVHFISLRNPCSDVPAQQAPHGTGLTSPLVAPNPDFALCRGVWAGVGCVGVCGGFALHCGPASLARP